MAIRILSSENITGDITTSGKVNAGDRILTEATTSNPLLQVKYDSSNYLEAYYNKLNVVGGDFFIERIGDTKIQLTVAGTTFTNLSNTSAASSSVDEVKIGTFGAGRPALFFGTSNTTYTNSTWFIENIGAAGKFRIGRNGLDVLEIENNGASLIKGPSLTVIDDSDPSVAVSDTDTNYKGIMTWRNSGSENVLEFVTRYAGTYYTNNLVLDRGKAGIGTGSPGRKLTVTGDVSGDANNLLLSNENDTNGDSASIGFSMLSNNTYVKAGIFFQRITTQGRGDLIFANNNEVNGNNVGITNEIMSIRNTGAIEIKGTSTTLNGKAFITNTNSLMTIGSTQSSGVPKDMAFFNGVERIRIQATTGNVGIGVTNPSVQLEVGKSATIGAGAVTTSTTNFENVLKVKGKNNYSNGTTWFGDYGQILLSADTNMTGSARQFLITNALDNNKFGIIRSVDGNTVPVVNSTSTGVNSGTADFVIDSGGNVGIGTTTPTTPLHVNGIVRIDTSSDIAFYEGASVRLFGTQAYGFRNSAGTYVAQISLTGNSYFNGGNVGIGETAPDQRLNVREDGGSDVFRGIEVHNNSTNQARAGICFKAYDWVQSAIWHGRGTSAAYNGALVLGTNPNTSDLTVGGVTGRMWILNNGNVGIGTDSPAAKLHVSGTSTQLMLETPNSTNDIDFRWRENGTNKWNIRYQNATEDLQILNQIGPTIVQMHFEGSNARVGVGTDSPTGNLTSEASGNQLHLRANTATSGKFWNFDIDSNNRLYIVTQPPATGVYMNDGATSWTGTSDETLKENVKPLENVLEKIKDYRCVEYNLKIDKNKGKKIGFIAQDWKNDFAPIVDEDNDGLLGMKYTETIPVLLKAIQELKAEIELLKNK